MGRKGVDRDLDAEAEDPGKCDADAERGGQDEEEEEAKRITDARIVLSWSMAEEEVLLETAARASVRDATGANIVCGLGQLFVVGCVEEMVVLMVPCVCEREMASECICPAPCVSVAELSKG